MKNIYGFIDSAGAFVDCGSEQSAKNSATRGGYTVVGYRSPINNMFVQTHKKRDRKWMSEGEWREKMEVHKEAALLMLGQRESIEKNLTVRVGTFTHVLKYGVCGELRTIAGILAKQKGEGVTLAHLDSSDLMRGLLEEVFNIKGVFVIGREQFPVSPETPQKKQGAFAENLFRNSTPKERWNGEQGHQRFRLLEAFVNYVSWEQEPWSGWKKCAVLKKAVS